MYTFACRYICMYIHLHIYIDIYSTDAERERERERREPKMTCLLCPELTSGNNVGCVRFYLGKSARWPEFVAVTNHESMWETKVFPQGLLICFDKNIGRHCLSLQIFQAIWNSQNDQNGDLEQSILSTANSSHLVVLLGSICTTPQKVIN